jgi:type IV pilus assembly protein PilA
VTIEIAAVIATTLIVVAVGVSAYRTYSVRREIRASLEAVAIVQELVVNTFEHTGIPPATEREVTRLASVTLRRPIEAVAIEHGRIELRFGETADRALRGRTLHVTPFETTDSHIVWICGRRPVGVGLYPLGFFNGTNRTTETVTTIEARYLPAECR